MIFAGLKTRGGVEARFVAADGSDVTTAVGLAATGGFVLVLCGLDSRDDPVFTPRRRNGRLLFVFGLAPLPVLATSHWLTLADRKSSADDVIGGEELCAGPAQEARGLREGDEEAVAQCNIKPPCRDVLRSDTCFSGGFGADISWISP